MAAKSAKSRDVWFVAAPDFFGGESLESAAFREKGGSSLISYCSAVLEINHLDHNRLPQSHTASHLNNVINGTYFPVVAFVSKELVLLAHKCDFALEVCEIRSDGDLPFTLPMVCILKLPSLHPSTRVQFYMYDQTPFAMSNPSPLAVGSNRLPFQSSPVDALLGFEFSVWRYGRPGSEVRRLAFWVHHSTFVSTQHRPGVGGLRREPRSRCSCSRRGTCTACMGWCLGWSTASATLSPPHQFCIGWKWVMRSQMRRGE